jgi:pimeloyl-ACP methyl ester carboxylesterase
LVDEIAELVASGDAELGVGAVQVRGDGAGGQEEQVGDLPVGHTASGEDGDLALLGGELVQRAGEGRRGLRSYALGRLFARTDDRDQDTDLATDVAQFEAARVWSMPDHSAFERLQALEMPVFAANGDSDQMILTHNTHLLAGLIPQARVKIYPDADHGFLFQHHAEFAADVGAFPKEGRRTDGSPGNLRSRGSRGSAA